MIQKLGRHSFLYFIGKTASAVFAYLTIILFIRFAGKEEYGKYSLILSIILFVTTFSSGWINQIILRYRGGIQHIEREDFNKFIFTFISISILIGSLIIAILLINTPGINIELIVICILSYFFIFLYSIKLTIFQSGIELKKYILIELLRSLLILLIPVSIFIMTDNINAITILFSVLITYSFLVLFMRTKINWIIIRKTKFSKKKMKEYLLFGIPIGFWLGSIYLISLIDKYLITYFIDYESTGIYSAVYDLIQKSLSLIFVPILTAAHPLIMNTWMNEKTESIQIICKSLKYELTILPVVLIGVIALSPILAKSIAIDTALFLKLSIPLSISAFLWHISMLLHKPLELNNQTVTMLGFAIVSLLTGACINIIFIPKFGYLIAAYTSLLTAFIYAMLVGFKFIKWQLK